MSVPPKEFCALSCFLQRNGNNDAKAFYKEKKRRKGKNEDEHIHGVCSGRTKVSTRSHMSLGRYAERTIDEERSTQSKNLTDAVVMCAQLRAVRTKTR